VQKPRLRLVERVRVYAECPECGHGEAYREAEMWECVDGLNPVTFRAEGPENAYRAWESMRGPWRLKQKS
jgi:hypothetical protein